LGIALVTVAVVRCAWIGWVWLRRARVWRPSRTIASGEDRHPPAVWLETAVPAQP
jgi:hypothetical protein